MLECYGRNVYHYTSSRVVRDDLLSYVDKWKRWEIVLM